MSVTRDNEKVIPTEDFQKNQKILLENALRQNLRSIFKSAADNARSFVPMLGDSAVEIFNAELELHLGQFKKNDALITTRSSSSMGIVDTLELIRDKSRSPAFFFSEEESTFLDTTREMNQTANDLGYLGDVSNVNETILSRPSNLPETISNSSLSKILRRKSMAPNMVVFAAEDEEEEGEEEVTSETEKAEESTIVILDDTIAESPIGNRNFRNITSRRGNKKMIPEHQPEGAKDPIKEGNFHSNSSC